MLISQVFPLKHLKIHTDFRSQFVTRFLLTNYLFSCRVREYIGHSDRSVIRVSLNDKTHTIFLQKKNLDQKHYNIFKRNIGQKLGMGGQKRKTHMMA